MVSSIALAWLLRNEFSSNEKKKSAQMLDSLDDGLGALFRVETTR